MDAQRLLNHTISLLTPKMHAARRTALTACTQSLLNGASATVTAIGREIASTAYEKHQIKRADRLCSNQNLHNELTGIYARMSYLFGNMAQRPLILVDWSDLDEFKRHHLLRASVAFDGRSITLYEEVHTRKQYTKPDVHRLFLQRLKAMLGPICRPIIVSDAGYKTPWFREVTELGWDYVGRVRLPMMVKLGNSDWLKLAEVHTKATGTPKLFHGQIARDNALTCRLALFKGKSKGRQQLNRFGKKTASKRARHHARSATEPWLLATSLPVKAGLAKRVVKIYQQRMQIEEGFRDMKDSHYGLGLTQNRTYTLARLRCLILMTTLASLVLILIGIAMTEAGKARRYQANTETGRRVLSLHFLGLRGWRDHRLKLNADSWEKAIQRLTERCQVMSYEAMLKGESPC